MPISALIWTPKSCATETAVIGPKPWAELGRIENHPLDRPTTVEIAFRPTKLKRLARSTPNRQPHKGVKVSDISLPTNAGPAGVTALKAGSVGTGGAIVQSAGLIAPAVGLTSANVFIAGLAGEAAPLTMVIGTIVCLCFAKAIGDYARKLPSAGSFYTYLTKTFDARVGFVAGAILFLAYLLLLPFQISFVGLFIQNLIASHVNIPWQVFAAVLMVVSTGLAVAGVQPALRVALGLLAIELFAFTLLALLIIVQGGATGNSIQPFNPGQSLTGFSGIALSVVFTIFLFAGFESSTALGEEVKDTTRTIPASSNRGRAVHRHLLYRGHIC